MVIRVISKNEESVTVTAFKNRVDAYLWKKSQLRERNEFFKSIIFFAFLL